MWEEKAGGLDPWFKDLYIDVGLNFLVNVIEKLMSGTV